MKSIFCLFFMMHAFLLSAQKISDNMSDGEIVALFFNSTWDTETQSCVWKPTYQEKILVEGAFMSEDDFVDSFVMKIKIAFEHERTFDNGKGKQSKTEYKTIVAYTEEQEDSYHIYFMSIIVLYRAQGEPYWKLLKFNRQAEKWGDIRPSVGEISASIININAEEKLLRLNVDQWHMGEEWERMSIYALGEEIHTVDLTHLYDGSDAYSYRYTTEVEIDRTEQLFTFHKKGTDAVNKNRELIVVPVDERKTYKYENGHFILQK